MRKSHKILDDVVLKPDNLRSVYHPPWVEPWDSFARTTESRAEHSWEQMRRRKKGNDESQAPGTLYLSYEVGLRSLSDWLPGSSDASHTWPNDLSPDYFTNCVPSHEIFSAFC